MNIARGVKLLFLAVFVGAFALPLSLGLVVLTAGVLHFGGLAP